MIPVDLNRLREALSPSDMKDTFAVIDDAAEAVLNAPTVLWCGEYRRATVMLEASGVCGECGKDAEKSGCGPVALVPVKGED